MRLLPARRTDSLAPLAGGTRVPAGVLRRDRPPRHDGVGAGWVNGLNGMGSLRDTQAWSSFDAGARLDPWVIRELLRADGLAYRICFREGQDALRRKFEPRGSVGGIPLENDPEQLDAWAAWMKRLGVPGLTVRARGLSRGHGGAAWVMWIEDGRRSDQPIDWANIRQIKWIRVVRGGRNGLIQPQEWDRDPNSTRFEKPRLYNVSFPRGGAGLFHWQRVIIWQGLEIDDQDISDNNGWGESVLDQVWQALARFGQSHQYAMGALLKLATGVFQSRYLANALAAGRGEEAEKRLEDVSMGAGLYGVVGIGEDEAYTVEAGPLSGVDAVLEKMIEILVMYTDQPEIVLRGKRPGGLSTAADGEFRGWYDYVASQQDPIYTPPLVRLLEVGSRALYGPTRGVPIIDPDIHWPSLWELTEAEKMANRKTAAEARAIDLQGAATPDEVRTDKDLDEWYQLGALIAPPEDEVLAEGVVGVQDLDVLQPDEQLIDLKAASEILGYGPEATKAFASQHGALFRPGSRYKVARSLLIRGLRAAQVEAPSVEPATPGALAPDGAPLAQG